MTSSTSTTVDSGGIPIHVEVTGPDDGNPVLLVHGFPDTGRLWSKQVGPLSDAGHKVIVPDLRGYGQSGKPDDVDSYNLMFLAADMGAVLDHLGVAKASVVGHDWGSAVAWGVASLAPDRVEKLVALSVGHPLSFGGAGFEQREKSWYMLLFQFEGIAEEWLSANDWANFRDWAMHPDADAVTEALENDKSLTPGLNYYRANVHPRTMVEPPMQLPQVQAPTMGVWSTGDFALTEKQMTGSEQFVDGPWRYERLDGPGHWMQWEAPEKVNGLLLDFLGR
ncbi:MAG TPA: alpha/beta hydrolase [Acidimicrobiales bacterium]|nr:alpha/beta hydrolase [Acidimicrobiales bacterium]